MKQGYGKWHRARGRRKKIQAPEEQIPGVIRHRRGPGTAIVNYT